VLHPSEISPHPRALPGPLRRDSAARGDRRRAGAHRHRHLDRAQSTPACS